MKRLTRPVSRRVDPEAGLAMVVVVTVLAALLAGGAVALVLQLGSTKQAGLIKNQRAAMFCAEAGLVDARSILQANVGAWPALLDTDATNNPSWYPHGVGMTGDIDSPLDGEPDYVVVVRDDGDGDGDPNLDSNGRLFIVSRCIKYPETPSEILAYIDMSGGGHAYRNQAGQGPGNTGNANE